MADQDEKLSTKIRNEYMADVECLSKYMSWIEKKSGKKVSSYYDGSCICEGSKEDQADGPQLQVYIYKI